MLGLRREDLADEGIDVWPDCWDSINVFLSLTTQWRMGAAGPSGLDYAAIPFVFRLLGVKRAEQRQVFEDIGVMEREALKTIGERQGK